MTHSLLEKLVDEVAAKSLTGTVSVAVQKMAEEIAREVFLDDPEFKALLRTMVRERSRVLLAQLLEPQNGGTQ